MKEKKNITEESSETSNLVISEQLYVALSNVATGDTTGWVLTKCLSKIVKNCFTCRETLMSKKDSQGNEYTWAKEYNKNKQWLC